MVVCSQGKSLTTPNTEKFPGHANSVEQASFVGPALVVGTMVLHTSAFCLAVPLYAELIFSAECARECSAEATSDRQDSDRLKRTQKLLSLALLLASGLEFLTSGVRGALCDWLGTGSMAAVSQAGKLIEYAIVALCADSTLIARQFHMHHIETWIVVAASITGLAGDVRVPGLSSLSKISSNCRQLAMFGKATAGSGFGLVCGPIVGFGILRITGSLQVCFMTSAFMSLVAITLVILKWPRSVDQSATIKCQDSNPIRLLTTTFGKSPSLRLTACIHLAGAFAVHVAIGTMPIFAKEKFGWGAKELLTLLLFAGTLAPLLILFVTLVVIRVGSAICVLRTAIVANILGYALWFVSGSLACELCFSAVTVLLCFGSVVSPILMHIAVQEVEPTFYGRLYSAFLVLEALARAISSLIAGPLMQALIDVGWTPAIFLLSCAATFPALYFAFQLKSDSKADTSEVTDNVEADIENIGCDRGTHPVFDTEATNWSGEAAPADTSSAEESAPGTAQGGAPLPRQKCCL